MYKIIFLGSNPSEKSESVKPFWHDTGSLTILSKWIDQLDVSTIDNIHFMNVANYPTPSNRPLKTSEIKVELDRLKIEVGDVGSSVKIVALGKTAEKALTLLGLKFYSMPHPSGLNRKLNDKTYVEEKVNGLRVFLNNPLQDVNSIDYSSSSGSGSGV